MWHTSRIVARGLHIEHWLDGRKVVDKEYLARMKRPEVKDLYKKRCEIAEFPHLWFKGVKNLRRFSVRGLVKAEIEAKWIALA